MSESESSFSGDDQIRAKMLLVEEEKAGFDLYVIQPDDSVPSLFRRIRVFALKVLGPSDAIFKVPSPEGAIYLHKRYGIKVPQDAEEGEEVDEGPQWHLVNNMNFNRLDLALKYSQPGLKVERPFQIVTRPYNFVRVGRG